MTTVREILKSNKLKPKQLCRFTGLSEAQVVDVLDKEERGELTKDQETTLLKAVANTLGVRLSVILNSQKSENKLKLHWKYKGSTL
ncbi:hypothetical protein ABQD61_04435 [Enterococcus asini]|uniref:hypothetical protein n=1 Tax=Enterococcus asini TaxID=57732 RepID=UPI0032E4C79B